MSRIDRSKLNPNFVKSSSNSGGLQQFGDSRNGGDSFVAHFVSTKSGGAATSNSGDVIGGSATDPSGAISQAILKKAATTGVLSLANKNLSQIPSEIWNLEESIIRDDKTKWWEYTDVTTIDLSSNQISEISPEIAKMNLLKKLDIHDNCLVFIPNELASLQDLVRLDISRNKIERPLPPCMGSLTRLVQLNANNNKLTQTGLEYSVPPNLGHLDLSFNHIIEVPPSFGAMKKLQVLNMSQNKIVSIAIELSLCSALQDIDLSHNNLTEVPAELGDLPELVRLNLNNNKLHTFPKFTSAKALKELYFNSNAINTIPENYLESLADCLEILLIADNQLNKLPQNFDMLKNLASLDVSCNNLTTLPDRLGLLRNLKNLKVDGNPMRSIRQDVLRGGPGSVLKYLRNRLPVDQLEATKATVEESFITDSKILNFSKQKATEIPEKLLIDAEVKKVQTVNLEGNKFSTLTVPFTVLKHNVTELNLGGNCFTCLPDPVTHFYNLQSLKVYNNKLSTLPDTMINLSKLVELNVSANCFTQIPRVVYSLVNLQNLSMADNQITEIDAAKLREMHNLNSLDLQNNALAKLPPELGLCEQLKNLSVIGNGFKRPTFAELNKGTVFILQKLRNQIVQ